MLPAIDSMKWRRAIVWEDVLFEAPAWAKHRLPPAGIRATKTKTAAARLGRRQKVIIEVFKRPKWDRMSLYNVTSLGYDATNFIILNTNFMIFDGNFIIL